MSRNEKRRNVISKRMKRKFFSLKYSMEGISMAQNHKKSVENKCNFIRIRQAQFVSNLTEILFFLAIVCAVCVSILGI